MSDVVVAHRGAQRTDHVVLASKLGELARAISAIERDEVVGRCERSIISCHAVMLPARHDMDLRALLTSERAGATPTFGAMARLTTAHAETR